MGKKWIKSELNLKVINVDCLMGSTVQKMPAAGFRKTLIYWCSSGHGGKLLFCTELVLPSPFLIAENNRKGHLQWIAHPRRDGTWMSLEHPPSSLG